MKRFILPLILVLLSEFVFSQQRDLNFYLEKAKITSPLIQRNRNDNKILDLDLQQTERILKNPTIDLESNVLFAPIFTHTNSGSHFNLTSAGADNYSGYDLGITNGGQYQAFISLKQPLLGNMNYKVYSKRSEISHMQNENSTIMTIHEMEQLVGYQYILCLKSKAQLKNEKEIINLIDEQLGIMQKLVDNAIYKQSDLMLLQIEKQNEELNKKSFEDDYKSNLYDLNLLCGLKDSVGVDIHEIDIQLKPTTNTMSKFLASFKLDSLGIIADLSINDLKYKPQLSLFANAGLNAVNIPTFNRLGFSAGLTFSWNLYDGNQRKLERAKSSLNINSLQFDKEHFITQQEINKDKIKNQMKALDERGTLLENQLNQYDKLYKAYEDELAHGLVSVMDFKNLLKDITAKKQDYLLQKMEKQLLVNSYNYWNY
ncbi:MAG: TolC family protein [Paludibacter sp.]|nr:TolC family protein [Paludibacter sp.]